MLMKELSSKNVSYNYMCSLILAWENQYTDYDPEIMTENNPPNNLGKPHLPSPQVGSTPYGGLYGWV